MPIVPHDPTSLALAIKGLQGDQALLQRDVSTNISNLTSSTQALQADVRHLTEQISEVTRLQQQQVMHSEGLNRAFSSLDKLATRLDTWIERHEGENRVVADAVTDFRGRFKGLWMTGGAVVFLASLVVSLGWGRMNERFAEHDKAFSDAKAERALIETRVQAARAVDVARIESELAQQQAKVDRLEQVRGLR